MRGPTAWPGAMPGRLRAAGLHNVDARIRRQRLGQHRTNPAREDGLYDIGDVGVFLGLDVDKSAHHGHGPTPASTKFFDKQLPNSEQKLRAVSTNETGSHVAPSVMGVGPDTGP